LRIFKRYPLTKKKKGTTGLRLSDKTRKLAGNDPVSKEERKRKSREEKKRLSIRIIRKGTISYRSGVTPGRRKRFFESTEREEDGKEKRGGEGYRWQKKGI